MRYIVFVILAVFMVAVLRHQIGTKEYPLDTTRPYFKQEAFACLQEETHKRFGDLQKTDAIALGKDLIRTGDCHLFPKDLNVIAIELKWDGEPICVIPRGETTCWWTNYNNVNFPNNEGDRAPKFPEPEKLNLPDGVDR